LDDLNVLLSATWQRSTNVQTEPPQETQQSEKPSRRGWLVAAVAFAIVAIVGLGVSLVATNNDNAPAAPPARPITFETTLETGIDFSTQPFSGTFEVTEGADTLGCSNGTWEDANNDEVGELQSVSKLMTCSEGDTGTFTINYVPGGYDTGPGDNNGPWRILDATDDFTGLQGEGDWWTVGEAEILAGDIEYTS
jgi:hypothetical protein